MHGIHSASVGLASECAMLWAVLYIGSNPRPQPTERPHTLEACGGFDTGGAYWRSCGSHAFHVGCWRSLQSEELVVWGGGMR